MNRREMLKTVVGGAVVACVGLPCVSADPYHIGVDLATGPSVTTFAIGAEGFVPLVITHGSDGIWRASRDGVEWSVANFPEPNWVRILGSNGDCKMRIRGDNIVEIAWLRLWDSPETLAEKYDLPELLEIVV